MGRLQRIAIMSGTSFSLVAALLGTIPATASGMAWASQTDSVFAGWGDDPSRVPYANNATILVTRDFSSTSGLGRTIFVDVEINSSHCDTIHDTLTLVSDTTIDSVVGSPADLILSATSAHYSGKVSLRELTRVYHHCAAPTDPVITTRDLGSVSVTADWVFAKRVGVHVCTLYATPPPPTLAFTVGWRAFGAQASMSLAGGLTLSAVPATQYSTSVLSTATIGGIPAVSVPSNCVSG